MGGVAAGICATVLAVAYVTGMIGAIRGPDAKELNQVCAKRGGVSQVYSQTTWGVSMATFVICGDRRVYRARAH